MKRVAALLLVTAWVLEFALGIQAMEDRLSLSGLGFLLLLSLPYLLGLGLLRLTRSPRAATPVAGLMIFLALAGSSVLLDAFYIHPDPQSGLALITVAVYGMPIVALAGAIGYWLRERN